MTDDARPPMACSGATTNGPHRRSPKSSTTKNNNNNNTLRTINTRREIAERASGSLSNDSTGGLGVVHMCGWVVDAATVDRLWRQSASPVNRIVMQ